MLPSGAFRYVAARHRARCSRAVTPKNISIYTQSYATLRIAMDRAKPCLWNTPVDMYPRAFKGWSSLGVSRRSLFAMRRPVLGISFALPSPQLGVPSISLCVRPSVLPWSRTAYAVRFPFAAAMLGSRGRSRGAQCGVPWTGQCLSPNVRYE